jgi:hypothetical protein
MYERNRLLTSPLVFHLTSKHRQDQEAENVYIDVWLNWDIRDV